MRISDWSSDVCSFDLVDFLGAGVGHGQPAARDAGVVDEDRHRAEVGLDRGDHRGAGGLIGDRCSIGFRLAAERLDRGDGFGGGFLAARSEEHTSELQSLMRNSYAVVCLKKTKQRSSRTNKKTKTENKKQRAVEQRRNKS